jgi:hypothetical protein
MLIAVSRIPTFSGATPDMRQHYRDHHDGSPLSPGLEQFYSREFRDFDQCYLDGSIKTRIRQRALKLQEPTTSESGTIWSIHRCKGVEKLESFMFAKLSLLC